MKCRECENLIWSYAEGEHIWQCRERYCPDLDIERDCPDFVPQKPDIFTALSTLQAENEKLKDQLYDGEGVNLVNYWMQQAKIEENGHKNCQAENEKLRAELEQVKREFDGICEYIDSEGFLRKQFCENGNQDLEPCICPSLQEHPGYIDSDDCEGCDHFCNSWRGQKED